MLKLGIIGHPISHSLSPAMHQAALNVLSIEGSYDVFDVVPENLKETLDRYRKLKFDGLNVTIPHKVEVMKYLDEIDSEAGEIGAVNTITFNEGILKGYNTDLYGFLSSMPVDQHHLLKGKRAVILGCGGAARAVVKGLSFLGVCDIDFYVRSLERAHSHFSFMQKSWGDLCELSLKPLDEIKILEDTGILINCTPVGMEPHVNESPVDSSIIKQMPAGSIIYDLIYRPAKTVLLSYGEACNLHCINGIDMLVGQGVKALSLWTKREDVPAHVMKETILEVVNAS